MIRPYWGELFFSPALLHLDLNRCSHGCWYCFANLTNPRRAHSPRAFARSLGQRRGFVRWCLEHRQTVCVSNTSDPLADSNRPHLADPLAALARRGCRIYWQTKGGRDPRPLLDDAPCGVYVTLTGDDEARAARQEPGAPPPAARLALIADLCRRGCAVTVGLAPFRLEWWTDFPAMLARLTDLGVACIFVGPLHLAEINTRFAPWAGQPEYERQAASARQARHDPRHIAAILAAAERGAPIYSSHLDLRGIGLWGDLRRLGYVIAPTVDEFLAQHPPAGRTRAQRIQDLADWLLAALPSPELTRPEAHDAFYVSGGAKYYQNESRTTDRSWREIILARAAVLTR